MHLKSLLFATAAVVVASPALSADAIVTAEPEPVEYVRVCDAFGEGYFYIPGSETCLKLSGEVRLRVIAAGEKTTLEYDDATSTFSLSNAGGDSYSTKVRARLTVDAKNDTEFGVLHSKLRIQAENDGTPGTDATYGMDQGYLQLGGLFAGYSESAWVYSTNGGDTGFGGKGIYDGSYGYQQRNMLQYQFTGANWFAAVSLEDDADSTSWMPDVVGRLGGVVGGFTVFGVVGYDQDNGVDDDVWNAIGGAAAGAGSSEVGVKLGLNADIGAAGNLIVQGFYATGNTAYGATLGYAGQTWTPEWSVLAAYGHKFTPEVTGYVNGQYFADLYTPTNASGSVDAWAVSGGFKWTPVDQFSLTADAQYTKVDVGSSGIATVGGDPLIDDEWTFVMQLARSF
ncbi:porin [Hoeflea poritis]|uniref:Porin n=1 Tax=Hoeflea poritis TaxID=2993659 RepID=A0ABT4VJ72_9HYPH|nr:porin [Hoeflea poritis]MDA4844754.1 porin [Hoeflea poritis]